MFDENLDVELKPPSTFIVTQHCLDEGKPRNMKRCMVAESVRDQGGTRPAVNKWGVVSFDYRGRRHVGACSDLIDKIYAFDHDGEVEPFVFRLENVKSFNTYSVGGQRDYLCYYKCLSEKNVPACKEVWEKHG